MKHEELRELLPLYALDALPADERTRFEQALEAHPELWGELKALRETAADLSSASNASPNPELKAKVLGRVRAESPAPRLAKPFAAKPKLLWPHYVGQVAAAAAVVLLVWGGNWTWGWVRAFGDPNTKVVTLVDESRQQIGRYVLRSDGQMMLWANLPAPPPGKTYQLWGVKAESHLPMPTYRGGMMFTRMPPGHNILHITEEKDGGSPTPTELRALPIDESNI